MSHPPAAKNVVCVDFDGVLFRWQEPIIDPERPPLHGVKRAMKGLKKAGYTIVILTSRLSRRWAESELGTKQQWEVARFLDEQHWYVAHMLDKNGIPWDEVTAEKVPAEVYFDDKAMRAEGNYGLYNAVNGFLYSKGTNGAA